MAYKPTRRDVSTFGFGKTFVLPALLIFVVPVLSFLFFRHAESRHNDQARESILAGLRANRSISEKERASSSGNALWKQSTSEDRSNADFPPSQRVLDTINQCYTRYRAAVEYQNQKRARPIPE
jgi:hypothetical protein